MPHHSVWKKIEVLSQAPQSEFGVCHMACILNKKSKIHPPTQGKIPWYNSKNVYGKYIYII